MAKNRYGSKKGKKKGRKGRKSAGKRLARYNQLRRVHGKREAYAMVFGRHGGGKRKGKRRGGGGRSSAVFKAALAEVQARNKTTGWPATESERAQAAQIAETELAYGSVSRYGRYRPMLSGEEARRVAFEKRLAIEKSREAARRVSYKLQAQKQQEAKEARARAEAEAAREIERELSNLK